MRQHIISMKLATEHLMRFASAFKLLEVYVFCQCSGKWQINQPHLTRGSWLAFLHWALDIDQIAWDWSRFHQWTPVSRPDEQRKSMASWQTAVYQGGYPLACTTSQRTDVTCRIAAPFMFYCRPGGHNGHKITQKLNWWKEKKPTPLWDHRMGNTPLGLFFYVN